MLPNAHRFRRAEGLLPQRQLQEAGCSAGDVAFVRDHCTASAGDNAVDAQHLFSVYLHTQREFEGTVARELLCLRQRRSRSAFASHATAKLTAVHIHYGTFAGERLPLFSGGTCAELLVKCDSIAS